MSEGDRFIGKTLAEVVSEDSPAPLPLSFNALRAANVSRAAKWNAAGTGIEFSACELAGEVGEVCNAIKKLSRLRRGMKGGSDTTANIAEELADVVICADLLAKDLGIDLGAAVVGKFNATSEKHGFSDRLPPVAIEKAPVPIVDAHGQTWSNHLEPTDRT